MKLRLCLVDGHAYAYRAFYAIRELRSPAGAPVNAIYGFIGMMRRLLGSGANQKRKAESGKQPTVGGETSNIEHGTRNWANGTVDSGPGTRDSEPCPSHVLVVWDGGLDAARVAAWPAYKAQRPAMPPDLAAQLDEIGLYLRAAGVASYCADGVEADDYIAGVARGAVARGGAVVIASADKDFMQLVGPNLGLLNPADKSGTIWGAAEVRAKTGVAPEQVADWLSLIGDGVDNIPGVPGVGPKTAAALLGQFGSVDAIYARLGEVKSERVRAALAAAEPAVRRNQALVRLPSECPADVDWNALRRGEPDVAALRELYARWGFRSCLAELRGEGAVAPAGVAPEVVARDARSPGAAVQEDFFA